MEWKNQKHGILGGTNFLFLFSFWSGGFGLVIIGKQGDINTLVHAWRYMVAYGMAPSQRATCTPQMHNAECRQEFPMEFRVEAGICFSVFTLITQV